MSSFGVRKEGTPRSPTVGETHLVVETVWQQMAIRLGPALNVHASDVFRVVLGRKLDAV
jgi:hypothetical protein